ncbi:aldehyde dehydrogenase family protein [Frigoriflavimonas asaccharolytica]|uniref:Aldehyde dehydrogenase n=1 Tax=Frigoriflavimonas asaccharolytica TaxID=2735899 RepID=A0A8J8G4M1_9FLAO|nr:aldehyde dehydrogenase family protein [Frigoriflavimonas asaccharolytica]NRS91179.1 aldehyde dehydrogenase [Frigoriflavimonas asaccharolytica]
MSTSTETKNENILERPDFKKQYGNYIGGEFVAPVLGNYFDVISPIDGQVFTQVAHSSKEDLELAVDAASKAFETWKDSSSTERSIILNKIADRMEQNLEYLAAVETVDNGKAVRETLAADLPLAIDHFRYFAAVIRADEGSHNELDKDTVSLIVHEPLGVVAQIIPWNFPILMAIWKLAPALAAGNCVVLKPAESTPVSILILMELIGDLLPNGVVNIVNGFGGELGRALVTNPKVNKAAFTGSTATGRLVMQYATENIIPVTLELGGKSPNVFFNSVMDEDDAFLDKAIEGAVLFALNQGEICTAPSRLLVQEDIADAFIARVIERVKAIKVGNPLDKTVMMGAQASKIQKDKINSYIKLGKQEGAECLVGGETNDLGGDFQGGYYIQPTIFKGNNKMRIFQEEIFGPVLAFTTFKDEKEAIEIANDTIYGLGAGVWTRDAHQLYQIPRQIQAGRVWVNQYHSYPAGAPFGGYKQSGIGRENHKMMLDHYRQTKNMLISYNKNKLGFF